MSMNVAFIGLGVMGFPMAGHLQKAGYQVTVFNRTTAKAEAWAKEHGGDFAITPKLAAEQAEIVFMCVGNDDDLRSVVYGEDGVLEGMKSGAILVDHTTTSAKVAKEVAEKATEQSVAFLDAPVSGGQAGAENGVLTVMIGNGTTLVSGQTAMAVEVKSGDPDPNQTSLELVSGSTRLVLDKTKVGWSWESVLIKYACLQVHKNLGLEDSGKRHCPAGFT